jgi:hypothetical protein
MDIAYDIEINMELDSFLDIVGHYRNIYNAIIYDENEITEKDILLIEAHYRQLYRYNNWCIPDDPNDYMIEDYYAIYIQYAIQHNDAIVSLEEYVKYASYWMFIIPSEYLYPIINESLKNQIPVSYIYAVIYQESGNFKYLSSTIANSNGTIDYGLMGLNSANFDTDTTYGKQFLDTMFYFDNEYIEFDYTNQFHILKTCTKYLQLLIMENGYKNALIHYNGGSLQFKRNRLKAESIYYASKVLSIYEKNKWRDKKIISFDTELYKYLLTYKKDLTIPLLPYSGFYNILEEPVLEPSSNDILYTDYIVNFCIHKTVFITEIQYPYRKRYV